MHRVKGWPMRSGHLRFIDSLPRGIVLDERPRRVSRTADFGFDSGRFAPGFKAGGVRLA
jgi:hypothetical protein